MELSFLVNFANGGNKPFFVAESFTVYIFAEMVRRQASIVVSQFAIIGCSPAPPIFLAAEIPFANTVTDFEDLVFNHISL